jgi:hypothetical protein
MAMQAVPAFILIFLTFFIPESPCWLAHKDRNSEALKVIARLRSSPETDSQVREEYNDIVDNVRFERSIGSGSWSELLSPGILNRVILSCTLQLCQQWTGKASCKTYN